MVDDLFVALGIDMGECLHEVEGGDSLAASFMATKDLIVKLNYVGLYRTFSKKVGYKKY